MTPCGADQVGGPGPGEGSGDRFELGWKVWIPANAPMDNVTRRKPSDERFSTSCGTTEGGYLDAVFGETRCIAYPRDHEVQLTAGRVDAIAFGIGRG